MPQKPPDLRKLNRLLIVKLSAIGDVVHALPVSAALGRSFPNLELSWVVEKSAAPIVHGNPFIKDVIELPQDFKSNRLSLVSWRRFAEIRSGLRAREFDIALDLQGLSKSAIITWASGAKYRYGQDWLREFAPLFETRIPRRPESVHIVDQLLDVARFLGANPEYVEFPLDIPESAHARASEMLRASGVHPDQPFLMVNPSQGGGGYKGWAPEKVAALIDQIDADPGLPTIMVGSNADLGIAGEIAALTRRAPASLIGMTNLKDLAALLKRATVHVCGDTGSAHIAAAVGTRVITIFGRTDPDRLAPYGQRDWVVHRRDQCHQVCLHFHETAAVNRKQKCLSPPPKCMDAVQVEDVVTVVRSAISEACCAC